MMRDSDSFCRLKFILVTSMALGLSQALPKNADAFAGREVQIPNNQWSCGICHQNAGGGGPRTVFGEDTKSFGADGANVSWAGVCDRDSDGDGFTNGVELGDPDCAWMIGDPSPVAMVTDPNDAASAPSSDMPESGSEVTPEAPPIAGETSSSEEGAGEAAESLDQESSEGGAGCQMGSRNDRVLWLLMMISIFGFNKRRKVSL